MINTAQFLIGHIFIHFSHQYLQIDEQDMSANEREIMSMVCE
jgi:hypothetical protein